MTESQEIELGDEDMFDSGDAPEGLDTSIEAEGVPPSAGSEPDPGEDAEASLPASRGTSDPDFRSDYWAMQDKAEAGLSPIELDEDIYEFEIVGEDGEFVAAEDFFSSEEESTEEAASEPLSLPQDEFDTVQFPPHAWQVLEFRSPCSLAEAWHVLEVQKVSFRDAAERWGAAIAARATTRAWGVWLSVAETLLIREAQDAERAGEFELRLAGGGLGVVRVGARN